MSRLQPDFKYVDASVRTVTSVIKSQIIAIMLRYLAYIFLALFCLFDVVRSQCDECIKDEIKGIKAELSELQKVLRTVLRRIGEAKLVVILENFSPTNGT